MNKKFWAVKTAGKKSRLDLFGYVGGSKTWNDGFNEKEFVKDFRAIPPESDLEISINSFGGAVYTALSIFSLLKTHKGDITIRVDGAAMSAATIITSVPGAKVIMPKGSMMMIHHLTSGILGNAEEIRKRADDLEKLEQNVIDIYVAKSGKTVDEVKKAVNAETYFTAKEAVDFGLADEIDETTVVKNVTVGDFVMLNGLKVDREYFAHMPEDFIQAEASATAITKEGPMDLETLRAEHPEIVEAIRTEAMQAGAQQERERIQAIEEIAMAGHEDLVQAAKADGKTTAAELAVQMLKANKTKATNMLQKRQDDAQALAGLEGGDNDGLEHNEEAKLQQEAKEKNIIEAMKRGFNAV